MSLALLPFVSSERSLKDLPIARSQPTRFGRPIFERKECDRPSYHGRQTFEKVEPLPSPKSPERGHPPENPSRNRTANSAGQGNGRHEGRRHPRPVPLGEPEGQEENHAGKKARLSYTQEKAHQVKFGGR